MRSTRSIAGLLPLGIAGLLHGCGSSGGGSGPTGKYTSISSDALTMELKSGGVAVMTAEGVGSSTGTYVVDGEKIIVDVDGQKHTMIKDGTCLEDQVDAIGRMCKGGKAGNSANVSTRSIPAMPSGSYSASNGDGHFKLEFKPGNNLTLTASPVGGQPDVRDGTFTVEGDEIHATLAPGEPLVLKYVNNAYESTSFGLMLKFVKD